MEPNSSIELKEQTPSEPPQTIDVIKALERGEFGPFVLSLLHGYMPLEFLTPEGYTILHQATAFNAKEIVFLLVERLKFTLDVLSNTKQTALMIAANFGFLELIKYMLDHHANIDLRDECNFNALLYALKQGELTTVIYLLHRGSDITIKDNNGCDVVHWAAFKNNLFLLRLFKRLNLPLNEMDFHGFRPIDRAIANSSFEGVKFFLENISEGINVASMNFAEIKNEEIKTYMLQKIQQGSRRRDRLYTILSKLRVALVFGCYVCWMMLMILTFSENNSNYTDYLYSIVVILGLWVYLICYVFLLLKKEKEEEKTNMKKNNNSHSSSSIVGIDVFFDTLQQIPQENLASCSFFHLDNLLLNEEKQFTVLHYIAYLIESYRFMDVLDIDYRRVCPECLIYKPPKTKHCSICNKCVDFYHHHSVIFNRCFNNKNHLSYLGLLFLQEILNFLFLRVIFLGYYAQCSSWFVFTVPEIFYLISKQRGPLWSFNFLLNLAIWGYNSVFLGVELYGIANNLTFNELMNRQRYRYLFRKEKGKKDRIMYVYGKSTGFFLNCKNYIMRYFNSNSF